MPPSSIPTILMVGDSDIERWPESLYFPNSTVAGHSGSTLRDVLPYVERALLDFSTSFKNSERLIITLVCAGENDIGSGVASHDSDQSFRDLLDIVFPDSQSSNKAAYGTSQTGRYLIFLGPKFEPWLQGDIESRRRYVQMSKSFERLCTEHRESELIYFIDCLVMFCCPQSAKKPGALLGGKAKPDLFYFNEDQLHLSIDGYRLWKDVIDNLIQDIIVKHSQPS